MAELTLYHCRSMPNRINKDLTPIRGWEVSAVGEPFNDFELRLRVTAATAGGLRWDSVNYIGWDGAYYFLDSVDFEAHNISVLNCTMDVLSTYKDYIMSGLYLFERVSYSNPANKGLEIPDGDRAISPIAPRVTIDFPNPISGEEDDGLYVVNTAQAGYSYFADEA